MNKFFQILIFSVLIVCFLEFPAKAQVQPDTSLKYLWPTDASKYLTSAFCEYRDRRFHPGIDIKTWGKIGYKVFAIRPGYVWRIFVSPSGYGKAVYLKLDTGEIAVFAHLSKFTDKIQKYVDAEQKRRGRYRINLYLKPGQVPVKQGEVIAYTGQTGIGAPHLHFEIRDSGNQLTNPLAKGYRLPDKVRPIVTKVSLTPLDATSEVNGDYKPLILKPAYVRPGEYVIEQPITIWGNVGLGVSAYDKIVNSLNRFGVYSLKLFVDDQLTFSYRFDKVTFQENPMVDFERDYRLKRRGLGRFYNLYKDKHNSRRGYSPNKTWAGVLKSVSLNSTPTLFSKSASENQGVNIVPGALFPGIHDFRIELADYFDNTTTVSGKILVGATFDIDPIIAETDKGDLQLQNILTYDLEQIEELKTSVLKKNQWSPIPFEGIEGADYLQEKGGEGPVDDATETANLFLIKKPFVRPLMLRIIGKDQFGVDSYPHFYIRLDDMQTSVAPELAIDYDYYDDYLRFEMKSNQILQSNPIVVLYPDGAKPVRIPIHQIDLKLYIGRIDFKYLSGAVHPLSIFYKNLIGDEFSLSEEFVAEKVISNDDRIESNDQNFWVDFWAGSTYDPIYSRIESTSPPGKADKNLVGKIYDVEPKDVLLKQGARVYIRYPEQEKSPEKLGVYYKGRRGDWVFIDNKLDTANGTISAKVLSFEDFTLLRDVVPPEILKIRPANNSTIKTKTPLISVNVRDKLSGIKSENQIEIRLDGKKLIVEYDPERDRVIYQLKKPLASGRHQLSIKVRDRSNNISQKKTIFSIN